MPLPLWGRPVSSYSHETISLVWPTSARLGWIQGLRTCGELLNMPRQQSTSRQQDCAGGEIKENLNPQGHRRTVKTEKWDMHNGRQGRSRPFSFSGRTLSSGTSALATTTARCGSKREYDLHDLSVFCISLASCDFLLAPACGISTYVNSCGIRLEKIADLLPRIQLVFELSATSEPCKLRLTAVGVRLHSCPNPVLNPPFALFSLQSK